MRLILDVMGGDNPVLDFVNGAVMAREKFRQDITLVGNEADIRDALRKLKADDRDFTIVHADDVVTMHDDPMSILREHNDCSMAKALKLVAEGKGDAVVSAGNTGALFTGASLIEKRIRGVRRSALAMVLPYTNPVLLLDCGANVTVTAEYLVQFAYLGMAYMECVMGIRNPRIGLLNNGAEPHKGTPVLIDTNKLLSKDERLNFIGNVEGKDVPFGVCDVVVADGFSGNVMLKTSEGMSKFVVEKMRGRLFHGISGKLSSVLKGKEVDYVSRFFDAKEYGGAPFLGLSKPVIKAHGDSDAIAICAALEQAIKYTETGVIEKIANYAVNFPKITAIKQEE